jgi:hypothetical protein
MINERALDVRAKLKIKDNPSNIAEIFFKQLSNRIYDYVISNNLRYTSEEEIDDYLNQSEKKIETFKRALAEQAIYLFSVGDTNYMLPDESARWIGLDGWFKLAVCQAAVSILNRLGILEKTEVMW